MVIYWVRAIISVVCSWFLTMLLLPGRALIVTLRGTCPSSNCQRTATLESCHNASPINVRAVFFSFIVAAWTDRTIGLKRTRPRCPIRVAATTVAKAPRAPRRRPGKTGVCRSPSTWSKTRRDCCSRSSWASPVARWDGRQWSDAGRDGAGGEGHSPLCVYRFDFGSRLNFSVYFTVVRHVTRRTTITGRELVQRLANVYRNRIIEK